MAIIYGNRSTDNVLQSNRWRDIAPVIFNLRPDETPFTVLASKIRKSTTVDPKFEWFGKEPRSDSDAINDAGGYIAGDTALTVDNADKFLPGDLVRVIDGTTGAYEEMIRVTDVNTSTNVLTVERGVGSTAAGAIADDDILLLVGDAQPEGSDIPDGLSQLATEYYNYTQIFRTSTQYTRTFLQTKLRADDSEVKKRREEKSREHKRKIEKMLFWGERGISGAGGAAPNRKSGGLYWWIQQAIAGGVDNTTNVGGTMTEAAFETFLETKAFEYGGKEKMAFCAPHMISFVNNLERGKIELTNMENEYGINILQWHSPHGTLNFVRHKLFNYGIFSQAMMIVDMDEISLRYVGDSDMQFRTDIGVEGQDSYTDDWLSEVGLMVQRPETLALLTGVTGAA